ncbi:DUF1287 domain-containing protein [Pseudodesulfovibrio sp.]|nr:DUF1287 domain-containing protein [Pseudodesulfovibrio sp.]
MKWGVMRFATCSILILVLTATSMAWAGRGVCDDGQTYVLKLSVNLRAGPGADTEALGSLMRNVSLACLGDDGDWNKVSTIGGLVGWVRADLLSNTSIRIHKNERTLVVTQDGTQVLSLPVNPGAKGLSDGRYFGVPADKRLVLSWPNRQDMRDFLLTGQMAYGTYRKILIEGEQAVGGSGLALCAGPQGGDACGAFLSPGDFVRLVALVPNGARVEIYNSAAADREINRSDELSRRIHLGALEQLKCPAAGLSPESKVPSLAYPGGDIQPDFAASTDIVTRAARRAGLDLQALVHEDTVRHPQRYAALGRSKDGSDAHRHVPTLTVFLKHNALSLAADVHQDPYGFEPGDIVVFSTGLTGEGEPDRVGIVDDTFNAAGFPKVITVWDMGQSTDRLDVLGRDNPKVVGHFRMSHLFDYQ